MIPAAEELLAQRSRLATHIDDLRRQCDRIFQDLGGTAPAAAKRQLDNLSQELEKPKQEMLQVADVIRAHARLLKFREPLPTDTAQAERRAAEAVLDRLCAAAITAACTPQHTPAPLSFADFGGVDFATVHHLNYLLAPPEVQHLADENPDMILLETGPAHFVAAAYPGGAAALDTLEHTGTTPASVTTLVPGVGSSAPAGFGDELAQARRIAAATGGPAIAWSGYTAPATPLLAANSQPARDGGRDLKVFQDSLRQRWPATQQIVVGYSYGSVVTGNAHFQDVDDIVIVGSPGTTRANASELSGGDPGHRVWVARNADDEITYAAGTHGPDPMAPQFGARPLPGANGRPGSHTSYFDDQHFYDGLGAIAHKPAGWD